MENSWDYLDAYRGTLIKGQWPTICEIFTLNVKLFPERLCFTRFSPERESFTYREADLKIRSIAAFFRESGIEPGQRVVISGKNSPEWAISYLAILFAGGVVVPIDYQLETDRIVSLSQFVDAKFVCIDEERFEDFQKKKPAAVSHMFSLSPKKDQYILNMGSSSPVSPSEVGRSEDDIAAILFTSGTTGNEKGVMLTHANLMSDVFQACHPMFMTATEKDIWYALLPLHHSYTMTAVFLESIRYGSELVFAKRMVVKEMMRDLKEGHITMFMAIPLLYNKLLKGMMKEVRGRGLPTHVTVGLFMRISGVCKRFLRINIGKKIFRPLLREVGLDRIRICICGGGPLAPETFRRYNELGLDFVQGYGLTETSPIITLNPLHQFKLRSVGKVFPLVDMKILDPDEDGVGEIAVKGPNITSGYYRDPEATKDLFTSDGFLRTGDVGYLDKEHYLFLTGRKKSLIVTEGGKNVYPEEIEDHFQLFQEIDQIMIKGYIQKKETLAEGIEAIIYPSEEFFKGWTPEDRKKRLEKAVAEVNKELLPYKRITKMTILEKAMETTTTKKIKRNLVLRQLDQLLERSGIK
jgi:long-chain acyl-CoA synthetase